MAEAVRAEEVAPEAVAPEAEADRKAEVEPEAALEREAEAHAVAAPRTAEAVMALLFSNTAPTTTISPNGSFRRFQVSSRTSRSSINWLKAQAVS